ncbi:PEP-CTERM sorting domain-containing protein [Rubellicoccus peritrichatus]|uniref:PEP-CTERM sorting domain-containing protein n=1 Tax=Rubellicoccus peritrichatus TaxID=3080537 RepID=A0AAQ3L9F3_9BACT|nr:PEP-CTERM sorting domain-containing protein [Puniceicoccus sp. CR14]WOO40132.1 PEP-CTERM sorting domain-containing protein [Puniceicoccus sp. CR14]
MKKNTTTSKLPYSRTGLTALLGLGAATSANAAVVMSTTVGSGLRPPATSGSIGWDIDNDGANDFSLSNSATSAAFWNDYDGRILGKTTDLNSPFLKLSTSQAISSGVPGYGFAAAPQGVAVMYITTIGANASQGGWAINDTGFIGFKFEISGNTHFGWAEVTIDALNPGQGFIINEAWYNTTADQGLLAGTQTVVPEPSTYAVGLAGLALGAAGLRRWRKAKQASA